MEAVFSGAWENLTTNYKKYMYGEGQSSNGRTRSYSSSLPKKVTARPMSSISSTLHSCPQCEKPFQSAKDARVLECSHAFCWQCLMNLEYSQIIKCPICNASTILEDDGLEGLQPFHFQSPSVDDFGSPPKEPPSSQKRLSRSFETIDLDGDFAESSPQEVPNSRQLESRRRSISKSPPTEEGDFVLLEKEPLDELPRSYVPLTVDKDVSRNLMEQWIDSIWFPPSDLHEAKVLQEIKPLYVPFYNFTVQTTTAWDCQVGHINGEGKMKFNLVRDTFSNSYSQILTCATYSIPESLVTSLLKANGFSSNPNDKVPSDAVEYVSKLENELPIDFGPDAAYEIVARKFVEKSEREAAKSFIKREHRPDKRGELNVTVKIEQLDHEIIMLPIFLGGFSVISPLANIQYGGTTYEVLISGNTGAVVGNRPYGTGMLGKMMTNGWEKVRSVYNENVA